MCVCEGVRVCVGGGEVRVHDGACVCVCVCVRVKVHVPGV